jgi:hypothetical protein
MLRCCSAAAVAPEGVDDEPSKKEKTESLRVQHKDLRAFTKQMKSVHLSIDDYVSEASLFALLETPESSGEYSPCAVVDGEWLMRRAAAIAAIPDREERKRLALPRRQQLERDEPAAFMSVEQLRNLPRGDARISSPLPLVCISHTWHGREHPDPYGDNLLEFAKAVVEARKVERFPKGDFAVFWECVLATGKPANHHWCRSHGRLFEARSPSWMSLHQHPGFGKKRKGAEEVAFQRALSHMSLWYAHMKTLVYLLTATPAAWPSNTLPYSSRGSCGRARTCAARWLLLQLCVWLLLQLRWPLLIGRGVEPRARQGGRRLSA